MLGTQIWTHTHVLSGILILGLRLRIVFGWWLQVRISFSIPTKGMNITNDLKRGLAMGPTSVIRTRIYNDIQLYQILVHALYIYIHTHAYLYVHIYMPQQASRWCGLRQAMMQWDPNRRGSAAKILYHPYFEAPTGWWGERSINWPVTRNWWGTSKDFGMGYFQARKLAASHF